jgi:carbonic anhydrase
MGHSIYRQTRQPRTDFLAQEKELMERLARDGQAPYALFIGCSDSRVMPSRVAGAKPGDLFVLRNVANIVPPAQEDEAAVGAVLEYAVLHLCVPHVIVCGHLDCGGIRALDQQLDEGREPHIARWLGYARPVLREVELLGLAGEGRHRALVEANVRLQLKNLLSYSYVASAVKENRLTLHGWVYEIGAAILWYYDEMARCFRRE